MRSSNYCVNMKINRFFITYILVLAPMLTFAGYGNEKPRNDGKFVVVLDAGHGGHDPGNLGNGYLEKNIALNIVLKIGKILETNPDIEVIYTRKDDTFIDLYVRGEIANKANADLFVSVHCDSHSSDAHGAGTFVLGLHANKQNFEIAKKENSVIYLEDNYEDRYADYDINSPESVIGLTIMQEEFLDQSIALAKIIQDNFSGKLKRINRKVKQAGFIVLHQTFMPSVLVETGFLTNKTEGAYLNSKSGQSQMGEAIAEAILKYKNAVQANVADITQQTKSIEVAQTEETQEQKAIPKEVDEKPTIPEKVVTKEVAIDKKNEGHNSEVVQEVSEDEVIKKTTEVVTKKEVVVKKETPAPLNEADLKKHIPNAEKGKGTSAIDQKIIFKVQLLASATDLELQPKNFNGLGRLSREPYKNFYRYMYGITNSYEEAKMLKSNADLKGYTTSYIVAYKEGVRIPISEALKYVLD